jgi:hypothetical protein
MSGVMTMNDSLGMSKEVDVDMLLPPDSNTQLRRGRRETVAGVRVHDDVYGVFMTLPPYTSTWEGEVCQLECSPKPCRVGLECGNALMQTNLSRSPALVGSV